MKKTLAVMFAAFFGWMAQAHGQQTIIINPPAAAPVQEEVGPPPVLQGEPSEMTVVPSEGQPVYLVPGRVGVYFSRGIWYRFYGNAWYRSSVYGGPWEGIVMPPTYISSIPPDYIISMPGDYHRIGYRDFRDHWRGWDRDRRWDHEKWFTDHRDHAWGHHNRPEFDRFRHHSGWNRDRDRGHDKRGDIHRKGGDYKGGKDVRKWDRRRGPGDGRKGNVGRKPGPTGNRGNVQGKGGDVHRK